ncbi:MAG: hypothetical protein ACREIY_07515, partial [Candidatus Rokuibacteriota bacterium]
MRRLIPSFTVILALGLASACQTAAPTMSLEEAKKVTASFGSGAFVPPPRTINDLKTILEPRDPSADSTVRNARQEADSQPPRTTDSVVLGRYYWFRARAARRVGRVRQAIEDFTLATEQIKLGQTSHHNGLVSMDTGLAIRKDLAETYAAEGDYRAAIALFDQAAQYASRNDRGWLFLLNADLVALYATVGDLRAAERALAELKMLQATINRSRWQPVHQAEAEGNVAMAEASMLEARGRFSDAERVWRRSIELLAPFEQYMW